MSWFEILTILGLLPSLALSFLVLYSVGMHVKKSMGPEAQPWRRPVRVAVPARIAKLSPRLSRLSIQG